MPNVQVVADRFYVMKQINQELDQRRKQQNYQAQKLKLDSKKSENIEAFKKSKYAFLKNQDSLTKSQELKLEQVKQACPYLGKMHKLKEEFRLIFNSTTDWLTGLFSLGRWLESAKNYFSESRQTIIRWRIEIIAYFEHQTTNGTVEGINNKLKLIKRSAYGFRNFTNFQAKCLLFWHFNY